ncbi:2'-5' RNA ligase family protein [Rhizobium sp. 32-5/1]|uniref:2'-5' RNA ligase family protein n=1 Tax=Rhizobium sp. 32-5/1 TaxID=3019602 RepID=UPI00240D6D16|nr:2'-5' RNA ligase family protein [Rhizobium sp. 32-5/1]WEZ84786.1 2'-5' RNA ligase family protein [Rhizobium sp. 32-5/1]
MLGKAGNEVVRAHQQSFAFGDAAGLRSKKFDETVRSNLFLAIVPERDTALQAVEIGRHAAVEYGLSRHLRPHQLMHVSLNAVGAYTHLPDDVVFTVSEAMSAVRAMPFEVSFDRIMSFATGYSRPLVLTSAVRSEEMMDLHVQLAKEMWSAGLIFSYNPRFKPHMTLLYDEATVAERELAEPVRWTVREFVLIHSLVGRSEYEYLGRWPLLG